MSNEELILNSADGAELYNTLYMKNIKLISKLCAAYYRQHKERFKFCGIEYEDLEQECYFAIPEAVQAYRRNGSGMKFVTFLNYPVLNCLNSLCSMRTVSGFREPLNLAQRLEKPVGEEDDCTLSDIIPDTNTDIENSVTDKEFLRKVFPLAADVLSDAELDIIYRYYIHKQTLSEIAATHGISTGYMQTYKNKILRKLRRNKKFTDYFKDTIYMSISRSGSGFFKSSGMSSVEWAVGKMEHYREEYSPTIQRSDVD